MTVKTNEGQFDGLTGHGKTPAATAPKDYISVDEFCRRLDPQPRHDDVVRWIKNGLVQVKREKSLMPGDTRRQGPYKIPVSEVERVQGLFDAEDAETEEDEEEALEEDEGDEFEQ